MCLVQPFFYFLAAKIADTKSTTIALEFSIAVDLRQWLKHQQ